MGHLNYIFIHTLRSEISVKTVESLLKLFFNEKLISREIRLPAFNFQFLYILQTLHAIGKAA